MLCVLLFAACEKEELIKPAAPVEYIGWITYDIPVVLQETTKAVRTFSVKDNQIIVRWFGAPLVETAINEGTSYTITEVVWPGETWCNGKHIQTELIFNGRGSIQGDSLIEQGTVCKRVTINDILKSSDSGTWSARLKRYSYSPPSTEE
jgi:hypothetical protein